MNLFFAVTSAMGLVTLRPLIIYDYLLIPFLIVLRVNRIIIWIYMLAIVFVDVLHQLAFIYMFSVIDFIRNLRFYFLFDFSFYHYLLFLGFIGFAILLFILLKKFPSEPHLRNTTVTFFAGLLLTIYLLDTLNGRTVINSRRILPLGRNNLAVSYVHDVVNMTVHLRESHTRPMPLSDLSMTFRTFANDSTGNQLLILMESWGLPTDHGTWLQIQTIVSEAARATDWKVESGSTHFSGSTIQAELRELFSVSGDYHFLFNADSAKSMHSIFELKKNQGYTTAAIHSFSNKMFQRSVWWRNIDIDSVYFMEDVVARDNIRSGQFDYSTPFPALYDEDALRFLNSNVNGSKVFAYFLTVNSHLPFTFNYSEKEKFIQAGRNSVSAECSNQLNRIVEILEFIANDSGNKKWSKILIIGDHAPPFYRNNDREFYSDTKVPYFILSRPESSGDMSSIKTDSESTERVQSSALHP